MEVNIKRIERLKAYVRGLRDGIDGKKLYESYEHDINAVTSDEAFRVFYDLLEEGNRAEEVLNYLGKVINVFSHGFEKNKYYRPKDDRFLKDLEDENVAMLDRMNKVRTILSDKRIEIKEKKFRMLPILQELKDFDAHYLKKENILFPMLESKEKSFEGLSIMWALHDKARANLKLLIEFINSPDNDNSRFNKLLGELFFDMLGLKQKEEMILFPTACKYLFEDDWTSMYKQSMEYEFPFIDKKKETFEEEFEDEYTLDAFTTDTGSLTFEEVLIIFDALPLDLTYVDENNKVRYFSRAKDRIFPRSKAVIGRDVKNCHPPASVHIVEEIVENFRSGKEDSASFWIDINDRKILIQYFALRDNYGNYRGVLEASQDISQIQKLEGQRRVADWGKNSLHF